jgi:hypothetical protein
MWIRNTKFNRNNFSTSINTYGETCLCYAVTQTIRQAMFTVKRKTQLTVLTEGAAGSWRAVAGVGLHTVAPVTAWRIAHGWNPNNVICSAGNKSGFTLQQYVTLTHTQLYDGDFV